ncbi:pectate lyase [Hymenobacter swuensis]|uniref:Pectinesterase n=1 Tax=Hymenobacter swuensis DY53 TaxID=1227739 RepID=W8EX38_9BACT|nr:pectate lyase [Hymenobacter swuensis]AHJ97138.1 pectinesterase [Hymenobacter swuensis DY53]
MKRVLTLLFLLVGVGEMGIFTARAQQVTVAADGSGQFRTIQAALNSLPNEATKPRTVYIKNGTYCEKVLLDGKQNIILRGQSEKGVVLTYSQARDAWRCDPAGGPDDFGAATLNLRNSPDITLENLTVLNPYGFEAAGDVLIPCPQEPSGQRKVGKTGHQMALRTMPGTTRLIVKHCTFRALGGDTVSPWDVDAGLYYFQDCTMEGGVDFYCPRGWAYAENCRFICHNPNAAIWHDGSGEEDQKTVLKNCRFEGDPNFKLGRFHREAQFYLINCRFAKEMADADIYWAESGPGAKQWGRRVYYAGCHREGGDYAWFQDNLSAAKGSPKARQVSADWTFGGRWYPKSKRPATVPLKAAAPGPDKYAGLPRQTLVAAETGAAALPNATAAALAAPLRDSVADRMLVYQRAVGGWPKAVNEVKVKYDHPLTAAERAAARAITSKPDATIDNEATTREIRYLAGAFATTRNPVYRAAAEKGVRYLLQMQYPNGGFPQYYPDLSSYRHQITYNDDAMIRALQVLRDVSRRANGLEVLDAALTEPAQQAVNRGIECILKTQYVQNGTLTAWCAQHDEKTLLPAKARAFELAALSGMETVNIVRFLMDTENPTPAIRKSVEAAVAWLEAVKLQGFAVKDQPDPKQPKGFDRVLVPEAGSVIWARFYDLKTNQPIYVGRDSQPRAALADIEYERRTGYAYAGVWPAKLLSRDYPRWQQKWNSNAPQGRNN